MTHIKRTQTYSVIVTLLMAIQFGCVSSQKKQRRPAADPNPTQVSPSTFPSVTQDKDNKLLLAIQGAVMKEIKLPKAASKKENQEVVDATNKSIAAANESIATTSEAIRHYFQFLGLTAKDFEKVAKTIAAPTANTPPIETAAAATAQPVAKKSDGPEEGDDEEDTKTPSNLKAIQRVFAGSTQFLFCNDLRDWECLERKPLLPPTANYRVEGADPAEGALGAPIHAGEKLDMDVYFTEAWDGKTPRSGVVDRFAEYLTKDVSKSLSMAIYGIDDIDGSMKPVYDKIRDYARDPNVNVRAVVDVSGIEHGDKPWIFSYKNPKSISPDFESRWLFGPSTSKDNVGGMHTTFQYSGTPNMIHEFNDGIESDENSRLRIEWATSHIMHNKFAVLENAQGGKSVWTGTANMSNHCMGAEANSNMAVYIRNDQIANAYLSEFNLMYNFDSTVSASSKLVTSYGSASEVAPFKVGRFHTRKLPISHRLFTFDDGTKVRVHFAPTDDAEHRVILPMLYSAQPGDLIRVSMFGGTGYEIVRAFQYAVARGANVKIVFDSKLAFGTTSWIRDAILNTDSPNPYLNLVSSGPNGPGSIDVRISSWTGKNHYKVGSLTRAIPDGTMRAEEIILGSQNWSSGGNDANDENLISIQNLTGNIDAAVKFNQEFDTRLWLNSHPYRAARASKK